MNDVVEMDLELINLIDHDTTKIYQHRIPQVFKPDNMEISEDNDSGNFYWNKTSSSEETESEDTQDKRQAHH